MRLCAVHEQGGVQPYRRKQQSNHDRLLQFIPLIIQHRSNAAKVKGSTKTWALWEKREDKKRNKKTKLSVFVFILLLFTPEQAFVSSENTHLVPSASSVICSNGACSWTSRKSKGRISIFLTRSTIHAAFFIWPWDASMRLIYVQPDNHEFIITTNVWLNCRQTTSLKLSLCL